MKAHGLVFSGTHATTYVADNMRNVLKNIIHYSGLDPTKLVDDWKILGEAVKTWLGTRDLLEITIEFYLPYQNSMQAVHRWDFPISYDGSGIGDDMWVAKEHIQRTVEKAGYPPAGALYDIILSTRPGRPNVPGMGSTTYRSTTGLVSRTSGTAIATPDIMASIRYWRAA